MQVMRIRKLLCATDLLPKSEFAIDRAGLLAAQHDASLSLLHVVTPTSSERVLEQTLQMAMTRLSARARPPLWRYGPQPATSVRAGSPARLILDEVERSNPDLLVVGPHRMRGVRDVIEGTIAEKVLASRKCPLLIVRQEPQACYRNVLLAFDLSPASSEALSAAESLVMSPGVRAKIVHAYQIGDAELLTHAGLATRKTIAYPEGWEEAAVSAIHNRLRQESAHPARYEVLVGASEPAKLILDTIRADAPELLVVGTRGRGRIHRALLGSVANQVLESVPCDVLIVPEGSFLKPSLQKVPAAGQELPLAVGAVPSRLPEHSHGMDRSRRRRAL